jgi:hypothetical protein
MTGRPYVRVPESGPDFPVTGEPREDEETLRDEIEYTRDDVAATVDELTGRAEAAAKWVAKPLVAASLLVLAAIGIIVAIRKRRS